jgi:hypothetical protein
MKEGKEKKKKEKKERERKKTKARLKESRFVSCSPCQYSWEVCLTSFTVNSEIGAPKHPPISSHRHHRSLRPLQFPFDSILKTLIFYIPALHLY